MQLSFLDDLMDSMKNLTSTSSGGNGEKGGSSAQKGLESVARASAMAAQAMKEQQQQIPKEGEDEDEELLSMAAFQAAKSKTLEEAATMKQQVPSEEFDGYALRDCILEKWGACYDMDFQRVDSFGFRNLYLNVMPFKLGGRTWRHETELDYLCHLQAIVEILQEYDQLDYVLYQIADTNKKPRANTSPLVAVPLRLDLNEDQVKTILGVR